MYRIVHMGQGFDGLIIAFEYPNLPPLHIFGLTEDEKHFRSALDWIPRPSRVPALKKMNNASSTGGV